MTAKLAGLGQLIEDIRAGSGNARSALLRNLLEIYLAQPNALAPEMREEFGAILAVLYDQADNASQREIAERLISSPAAPAALLTALAHSQSYIAAPVLRAASGFTDETLLEIVKSGDALRLSAIAQRKQISEVISEALILRGEAEPLIMLIKNQGAAISPSALGRAVAVARRCPGLQKPLTTRFDLPPNLLIRMFFFVAPELRREILGRAEAIEPTLVREAMNAIREALLTPSEEDSAEISDARRVIAEKAANDAVNEAFLAELMHAGEKASVAYTFAWIVGVDEHAVKIMFKDASLEPLVVACRASGLDRDTFATLSKGMVTAQHGESRTPVMLDLYEKISPDIAERLMRFWRLRARATADAAKIASLLQGVEGLSADRRKAS